MMSRNTKIMLSGMMVVSSIATVLILIGWVPYRVFGYWTIGAPLPSEVGLFFALLGYGVQGALYLVGVGIPAAMLTGICYAIGEHIMDEQDRKRAKADAELRKIKTELDKELAA